MAELDAEKYDRLARECEGKVRDAVKHVAFGTATSPESQMAALAGLLMVGVELAAFVCRHDQPVRDQMIYLIDKVVEANPEAMQHMRNNGGNPAYRS